MARPATQQTVSCIALAKAHAVAELSHVAVIAGSLPQGPEAGKHPARWAASSQAEDLRLRIQQGQGLLHFTVA